MLRRPTELAGELDTTIAFAIQRNPTDRKQKHVALLYRAESGTWRLLHLGWHHMLCHEDWDASYYWVPFTAFPPEVTEGLIDLAEIIASHPDNQQIPYSISFEPGAYFADDGAYVRHAHGEGLTCATFLLALFRRWGLSLVDEETWPVGRHGDAPWGLKVLRGLHAWGKRKNITIPVSHFIEQLRQRWSMKRFRPEEVCACAGLYDSAPLTFGRVDPVARQLLLDLPR